MLVATIPASPSTPSREAGYQKREVAWDELMKANARLEPDLGGLKS